MSYLPDDDMAWYRRFIGYKSAVVAALYLIASVFLAIFGYVVAPDNAPDANTQLSTTTHASPGTAVHLLALKPVQQQPPSGCIQRLFNGTPLPYTPVAIIPGSLRMSDDSLWAAPIEQPSAAFAVHQTALWQKHQPVVVRKYWLGSDAYGRCIFSRLILGFRVSLSVGTLAVGLALIIGVCMGALGGYAGGRTDDLVMLIVNVVWSVPTLLLVFAVVMALGRSVWVVFVAVGLTLWVDVARLVRGQMMSLRNQPFAEAAYNLGLPPWRIILRHLIPNLVGPLLVVLSGCFATAILLESGLSYLGFGVQPPTPSWGSLLNENYGLALSGQWTPALAPALTIALTVWAFYALGNGIKACMR
jgi:peptide/nickel transport system permease protein